MHLGSVFVLDKFGHELTSVFDSYHQTEDLIPILKLQVANCFVGGSCKSDFLNYLDS